MCNVQKDAAAKAMFTVQNRRLLLFRLSNKGLAHSSIVMLPIKFIYRAQG